MRRRFAFLTCLLLLPLSAAAQDAPAPYSNVSVFDVPVGESMRFEEAVRQIVDAAGKAKLTAKFGWGMWQNDNSYAVVTPLDKLAELDDPMAWMRQFDNTPGQAVLMQAFGKLTGMHYREDVEVIQYVAEWSNAPSPMVMPAWAEVIDYWPVAGTDQQFDGLVKEAVAVLRSSNYPFMTLGYRTPVGRKRAQFIILFDDPGKHAAANAKLEQNPQWQALGARFMPLIVDMQTTRWRYRPELSYAPQ